MVHNLYRLLNICIINMYFVLQAYTHHQLINTYVHLEVCIVVNNNAHHSLLFVNNNC